MKNFFKNKTNIILTIILVCLIGLGTYFAINVLRKPDVVAVNFKTMNRQQIEEWALNNNVADKLTIEEKYDDLVLEGEVIYQSVKEGDKIDDSIIIFISKGPEENKYIEIQFDSETTEEQLKLWFQEYGFTNVIYLYENNEDYKEGKIISIDPTKARLDDKVTVKVASENTVDVPDFAYYVKKEIDIWASQYNIKVTYKYESSKNEEDTVIKQSIEPGKMIAEGSSITVTLSSGKADTGLIPGNLLGKSEEDFLKYVKDLGFTKFEKDEETYFSAKSKKDTIFSYDDGNFKLTETIKYAISNGQYTFDKDEYNDKNIDEVNKLVKAYNDRNAHITLKTIETKTSEHDNNDLYDCESSFESPNTTITCKLAKSEDPTKIEKIDAISINLLGKTEDEFVKYVKGLGFEVNKETPSYFSANKDKDLIYGYDHDEKGKQYDKGTAVNYRMTAGRYFEEFDADDYDGKTLAKANEVKDAYNARNAHILDIVTTEVKTSEHAENTLYGCSATKSGTSNTQISCKLAKKEDSAPQQEDPKPEVKYTVKSLTSNPCSDSAQTCKVDGVKYNVTKQYSSSVAAGKVISQSIAGGSEVVENTNVDVVISLGEEYKTILPWTDYQTNSLNSKSVDETKTSMNKLLGDFDLSYKTEKDNDLNVGTIISVSVNGNTSYKSGSYPLSTKIVITICEK